MFDTAHLERLQYLCYEVLHKYRNKSQHICVCIYIYIYIQTVCPYGSIQFFLVMQQPADGNLLKPKNNSNLNRDALPKNFKEKEKELSVHYVYTYTLLISLLN